MPEEHCSAFKQTGSSVTQKEPGTRGATAEESAADWSTGIAAASEVPTNLQCWPHFEDGRLARCKGEPVQVLEDSATGWPGQCLGTHKVDLPLSESCEEACRDDIACSSWQQIEAPTGLIECFHGAGYDCYSQSRQEKILRAQRFLRGHYRALMDLKGYEVKNLAFAFGSGTFGDEVTKAITACNHTCLSKLTCQVWTYSTGDGCWFEDVDRPPQEGGGPILYPPTSASFSSTTDSAKLVVAGRYVQRLCTIPQDLAMPTITPPAVLPVATVAPVTTTTSTAPMVVTPDQIASDDFLKDAATGAVYLKDEAANEKHLVRAGCTSLTCETPNKVCLSAVIVDQATLAKYTTGQDFLCSMLANSAKPSHVASAASPSSPSSASDYQAETREQQKDLQGQTTGSGGVSWLALVLGLLFCGAVGVACFVSILPWATRGRYGLQPGSPLEIWLKGFLPLSWQGRNFGRKRGYDLSMEQSRDDEAWDAGGFSPGSPGCGPPQFMAHGPLGPQGGGYPQQGGGYPHQQGGGYPQQQGGGYPQQQGGGFMQQMGGYMPQMPQMPQTQGGYSYSPAPMMDARGGMVAPEGYDLVTVTPAGLQVTPLGNAPVPQGVPLVNLGGGYSMY
ncbi:unnamed protein product [Polarella glacialis]|uniref:Apple domain-containing protein n=1 Tax=Polarella glacialis TaxID=89957 RepID=A0A813JZI7_POLGL|nr:unnamed protein product [Polarella glacialis]